MASKLIEMPLYVARFLFRSFESAALIAARICFSSSSQLGSLFFFFFIYLACSLAVIPSRLVCKHRRATRTQWTVFGI